jgi:NADH dehydrogenase FAD-containing subunit
MSVVPSDGIERRATPKRATMLSRSATSTRFLRFFHPILRGTARRKASTGTDTYEDIDVVIVGGGPAGLALASALGALL